MNPTRREFVKGITAAGAVAATISTIPEDTTATETDYLSEMENRCPYFDQPMYCNGLSKTGKPLCEE